MKVCKWLCFTKVAETRAGVSVQAWQAVAGRLAAARCSDTAETVPARAADSAANI